MNNGFIITPSCVRLLQSIINISIYEPIQLSLSYLDYKVCPHKHLIIVSGLAGIRNFKKCEMASKLKRNQFKLDFRQATVQQPMKNSINSNKLVLLHSLPKKELV